MDKNVELFQYVMQNAQMGQETLAELIGIVEEAKFKDELKRQLTEYKRIFNTASDTLKEMKADLKELNPLEKAMSYMTIKAKTLVDKTASHISDMMIKGSTMGITDMQKRLNQYTDVDDKIRGLAEELLKLEESNVEKLKKWL